MTLFEVEAPEIAAKAQPGQFLIVIAKTGGERVPLTICDYDAEKGTVSFAFHEVGKTTKELGTFNQGDCLFNVTGPLGNPSEIRNFREGAVRGRKHNDRPVAASGQGLEGGRKPCDYGPWLQEQRSAFHEGGGHGKQRSGPHRLGRWDCGENGIGFPERSPPDGEIRPVRGHGTGGDDERGERDDPAPTASRPL